jgi:outer membrane murein-binding lipoprotein Lpp
MDADNRTPKSARTRVATPASDSEARPARSLVPCRLPALALLAVLPALSACSTDANPMRDLAFAAGIGGEPKPAPDFITRTRPGGVDYLPIGVSAPRRTVRAKKATEVAQVEGEMDALKNRNEARAAEAKSAGSDAAKPIASRRQKPASR